MIDDLLYDGLLDLPWWGTVAVAFGFTHFTIVAVTVYLHRCQTHRALTLHPVVAHAFRLWLWMTTGMVTREWVAVHRKHHAKRETADDPHSPQVLGIGRVLWGGVFLYVRATRDTGMLARYGFGTPDDWIERRVYSRHVIAGLTCMGLLDVALFGFVPGLLVLGLQIVWIPFWAAGVINGAGHYWGYRNWPTDDASTNLVRWGILIGGEELHNNHHAYPTSARLSSRWFEIDIGWFYIRMLERLGLARVARVAPVPHLRDFASPVGPGTVAAVIAHRHDVLARYADALRRTGAEEAAALRRFVADDPVTARELRRWQRQFEAPRSGSANLVALLSKSRRLWIVHSMRSELVTLWERADASEAQAVAQLQDWCRRAEASGIAPLARFSERLRRYA